MNRCLSCSASPSSPVAWAVSARRSAAGSAAPATRWSRAACPAMKRRTRGSTRCRPKDSACTPPGNAIKGQFGQTNYSAAKAGMAGFSKALAQEVVRKGVTVNTVSPGYVETDMVMAIRKEIRDQIVAQIPMGRLAKPEEIAAVVAFLSSEEAGYITGANISVNGGMHMM